MRVIRSTLAVLLSMAAAMAMVVVAPAIADASQLTPFAYVAGGEGVSAINTSTNAVVATVPGGCGGSVAVTPDGRFAYVACKGSVQVISTATNTVVATVPLGAGTTSVSGPNGVAIAPNGELAYVTDLDEESVTVIETATNAVIATVHVGLAPTNVMITPDGAFAYVADHNGITVIQTSTNTVVATIAAAMSDGAFTPDGALAYVSGVGSVSVIDTASRAVLRTVTIPGDRAIFGVAITPDGGHVYLAVEGAGGEFSNGEVVVLSTAANTIVASVPVGAQPLGIAITPNGALAYVTNVQDAHVSVIDTATNTVVASVPFAAPFGVAITPPIMGPETPITVPIGTTITPTTPIIAPTTPITSISKLKVKPKSISATAAFSLPSAKQCVSHRKFTIHVRKLPGITWVGAVIKINGKRVKTVGRSHITALVNLMGLPKGTFVLSITAKASDGRSVTGTRTYHTCVPEGKSHYAPPKL